MNALKVRFRYLFIQITWHLHHAHFCMLDFYRSHTELLHTSSNTSIFLKHKNLYLPDILTRKSSKNFRNVIKYIEKFINTSVARQADILNSGISEFRLYTAYMLSPLFNLLWFIARLSPRVCRRFCIISGTGIYQ